MTKQCNKCKKVLPLDSFNKVSSYSPVRKNACRECTYKYAKTFKKDKCPSPNGPSLFSNVELSHEASGDGPNNE